MTLLLTVAGWLAFSFIGFYACFIKLWPRTPEFWRKVDYAWLLAAMLGVVPPITQITHLQARSETIIARAQAGAALSALRMMSAPEHQCRPFVRSELSPPNFEEVAADQSAYCVWTTEVRAEAPGLLPAAAEGFSVFALPRAPRLSTPYYRQLAEEREEQYAAFRAAVQAWAVADEKTEQGTAEIYLLFASPFVLAGAIALRATKVAAQKKGNMLEPVEPTAEIAPEAELTAQS